ncbi:MAG: hypothetical protein RL291_2048, partial [Pseudomonadota bacterium]
MASDTPFVPKVAAGAVTTIPATAPFLRVLAKAIMDGDLPRKGGPKPKLEDIAHYTILMPTNRAARALSQAFVELSPDRALLLPRIRPISRGEEDLQLMAAAVSGRVTADDIALQDAIPNLDRRLILTELVMKWSAAMRAGAGGDRLAPTAAAGAGTPSQAAKLAAELAQLMDLVETEGVRLDALKTLVPAEYAEHWGQTLEFLEIVMAMWPAVLAEKGLVAPAERRNASLRAEAERMRTLPPQHPVIVAGVTGSIPATRDLMAAVAALPQGAIVLPAFDLTVDEAELALIRDEHPEHPQHGLARLLFQLGVAPGDVEVLGSDGTRDEIERRAFLTEAMRPPAGTAQWPAYVARTDRKRLAQALTTIERIEAPTAADEAEAVALVLREAVETPGRTAALVSPDRLLARRVVARLEAWGIRVDDSAGRPFRKTAPGAFLDLVLECWSTGFAPADVVALLKHPFARLGLSTFDVRKAARALEIGALRGPVLASGLKGIADQLERARGAQSTGRAHSRAAQRLWDEDWNNAADLLKRLTEAYARLTALDGKTASLADFARAHVTVAEAIALTPEGEEARLWQEDAGAAGRELVEGLMDERVARLPLSAGDYPEFYRGLVAQENVRSRVPLHPRISIWGPFEARLQQPEVVVLGSLNDGTWPDAADPGPWLNRPMRKALG